MKEHFTMSRVTITANPSATIDDCLESLLCVAIAFDCEVVLIHNDRKYTTTATKMKATIIKE